MATFSELRWRHRLFMQSYPYRRHDWRPGAFLQKPLPEARAALVTTAAFHLPDQPPFDKSVRGGDFSYRVIPREAELQLLKMAHKSDAFDHSGIREDQNLALPLERFRELVQAKHLGSLTPRHFSFMGSITAPGRLVSRTAPQVAKMLQEDAADLVFLTPV